MERQEWQCARHEHYTRLHYCYYYYKEWSKRKGKIKEREQKVESNKWMGKRGKEGVGKRGSKRKKGRLMEKTNSIDFTKNVAYIPICSAFSVLLHCFFSRRCSMQLKIHPLGNEK